MSERDSARSYRHKLEHLVSKFRKLKMQHAGYPLLLSMKDTRIKELKQENTILQHKLGQHTELFWGHDWLASRTRKPVKENNMAKLDITVNELGAGDMCARGVSIIIDGISAEDATRVSLRLLSAIDPMEADDSETPQHVCTCHASDEDKRPPDNKVHVIRHTGKTSGRSSPEERHEDMKENALFPGV